MSAVVSRLAVLALLCAVAATAAGCRSVHETRGDELFARSEYESALEEYQAAQRLEPHNLRVKRRLEETAGNVAALRQADAERRLAAGDLEGAVRSLEEAVRLDPSSTEAKELLARERARLTRVRFACSQARRLLEEGDPLAAEAALAPLGRDRAVVADAAKLYDEVRRQAAGFLRDRAAKRTAAGRVEEAHADIERATQVEAELAAAAAARTAGPGSGTRPKAPGSGTAAGPEEAVGADKIEAWVKAAADVKRLSEGYPRKGSKGEAKDYAVPEEQLPALREAVERAIAARPRGERQPQWLAHGRLVLQMSVEVAAERHMALAREALAGARPAEALREVDRAFTFSADVPGLGDLAREARTAAARALADSAERAERRGLYHLARLRARQAQELDPYAASDRARTVVERTADRSGPPAVIVYPFQNLTAREGADKRLQELLLHRIESQGLGPVLSFDLYRRRREAGRSPTIGRIVKGDIVQLEVRHPFDGREPAPRDDPTLAALRRDVDEARGRLREARGAEARDEARARLEEAERRLARAERDRAAAIFASSRERRGGLVAWTEVRCQLHDPETGRDVFDEPIVRSVEGAPGESTEQVLTRVLAEAANAIAAEVEKALDSSRAHTVRVGGGGAGGLGGPSAAENDLEMRIALLEKAGKPHSGELESAARAVLEATGYSYAEKRTVVAKLRID